MPIVTTTVASNTQPKVSVAGGGGPSQESTTYNAALRPSITSSGRVGRSLSLGFFLFTLKLPMCGSLTD